MGYVVVVFCILNIAALGGVAYILWSLDRYLPQSVESAIQAEIRKQDDRIEKRQARAAGHSTDSDVIASDELAQGRMVAGRSHRRRSGNHT